MEGDVVRVGVVSDTHVPDVLPGLPTSLRAALAGVDYIVHAGDLVALSVLDELEEVAPTAAVAGNCDAPEAARRLPPSAVFSLGGRRVSVHHGHQRHTLQNQYIGFGYDAPEFDIFYQAMAAQLPGSDVIVFGHFHTPIVREWHGILFVNPGSIAPPHSRPTYAILELGSEIATHVHLLT
jgi:putative phosphoesterase